MKRKFIPVAESFANWKKDPEYAAAYASLDEEYAEAIRKGMEDVRAGRVRPLKKVFDEMRARYDIPR